ncbi:MAG: hypothetical protein PHT07_10570 [Paludibacter sp.]|nr:hypothetical protein [Paludibacter sp.]
MTGAELQTEWYYWSAIEETFRKKIPIKTFTRFAYTSSDEIALWEKPEFAKSSVAIYVLFDEIAQLYETSDRARILNEENAQARLRFVLRTAALFGAGAIATEGGFSAMQDHFENTIYKKGVDSMNTLFVIGQQMCSQLMRELYFTDPNYFINDIFAAISQVQRSAVLSKIYEYAPMIFDSLDVYMKSGIADQFFPFTKELKEVLQVANANADFCENQYLGIFKDGMAWINNSEHGMYSMVFTNGEEHRMIHFIEILRLYFGQNAVTLGNVRSHLLKKITVKMIEEKTVSGNFFSLSADVLKDDGEAEAFLARAYNEEVISHYKEKIRTIVHNELERHKKKLHTADKAKIAEIHKVVFSTLLEKIAALFAANTQYALLPTDPKELSSENFTRMLSEILRDAYIEYFTREKK